MAQATSASRVQLASAWAVGASAGCAECAASGASTCTAVPQPGYSLANFTGCDSVAGAACQLTDVRAARDTYNRYFAEFKKETDAEHERVMSRTLEVCNVIVKAQMGAKEIDDGDRT